MEWFTLANLKFKFMNGIIASIASHRIHSWMGWKWKAKWNSASEDGVRWTFIEASSDAIQTIVECQFDKIKKANKANANRHVSTVRRARRTSVEIQKKNLLKLENETFAQEIQVRARRSDRSEREIVQGWGESIASSRKLRHKSRSMKKRFSTCEMRVWGRNWVSERERKKVIARSPAPFRIPRKMNETPTHTVLKNHSSTNTSARRRSVEISCFFH